MAPTPQGPRRRSVYGRSRREVAEKLAEAISDRGKGLISDAGNITVAEYLDRWLAGSVRDTVRPSTYRRYQEIVRLHIKPALGGIRLAALSPLHVQALYRDRLDSGLSPATVAKIHIVLHQALDRALRWSLVHRNATEAVKAPRPAPQEMRPLSADEARRLLEAAREDKLHALYVLAVTTGMRQGELLGLAWRDVDLERGVVQVRRTLARDGGRLTIGEPKTKRSRRNVRLTETATQALRDHLDRQLEEIQRLGDLYRDEGLVFATEAGTPMNPSNLRRRSFAPLLKRAWLPNIRFHDLRHSAATLLLLQGVHPKFVQELLGHSTISITLDTYSHVLPGMGDQTARAMEDVLS